MTANPMVIGSAHDCSNTELLQALEASTRNLSTAIANVMELLDHAGYVGCPGDTTDDLRVSFVVHSHLVQQFKIKLRTESSSSTFCAAATSASAAYQAAADRAGENATFGITIIPIDQDIRAMEAARRALKVALPLSEARKVPALDKALQSYARNQRRRSTSDFKRLAGNDRD